MLNRKLNDCYKEVCELRKINNDQKPQNVLEVCSVNEVCGTAASDINSACEYLNNFSMEILKGRTLAQTMLVGKESGPSLVALKQLADNLYQTDMENLNINTEEVLQNAMSKSEDNLHHEEDMSKATNKFIQSLEYLMKYVKNQGKTTDLSEVPEISSFKDEDVVASSPILDP